MMKITILEVIVIFALTCLLPSAASLSSDSAIKVTLQNHLPFPGTVITVDDEPGDGDFSSIHDALDYANPGDTIEVYSGTYYESNFTISKPNITLRGIPHELGNGSDTGKPFIKGNDTADMFHLVNRSITLSGFRIENPGEFYSNYNIFILEGGTDCIISNNEIGYCSVGVISESGNNLIENNLIYKFRGALCTGIETCLGVNRIYNNTIRGGGGFGWGIFLFGSSSGSRIVNNVISDNAVGIGSGASGCYIANNTVIYNDKGIGVSGGKNNIIINNTVHHNNNPKNWGFGIGLGDESNFNTVKYNTLTFNIHGILIGSASFNDVSLNTISNNVNGICFDINSVGHNTSHNTVSYNMIKKNSYGVYLSQGGHLRGCVTDNMFFRNNFLNNSENDAFFCLWLFRCKNTWSGNYWGEPRILPKVIVGRTGFLPKQMNVPWVNVDWHPAREPYELS